MIRAKKSLGQNFLQNKEAIKKMVGALDITDGDLIIEIGPGLGDVTREILLRRKDCAFEYKAVELDGRFIHNLKSEFEPKGDVEIINDNFLDWLPKFQPSKPYKIIGSFPYYITSPIIHTIIKARVQPLVCVALIQKEVAEKIAAKVPDSSYLSIFTQTFYKVEHFLNIPNTDFNPVPKVDGGVLKMTRTENKYPREFISKYEGFLHRGFSNPRKMLNKVFTKEELKAANIDISLRPQNLGVQDWFKVYESLVNVF